ncbi:alpha/beta hydrolase [Streptomyces sp. NBC_00503]|uniref:alpha/beta hydrolase n=1 Tax=Streptomyces sp. NBC_00503 TaxID=2903659 RepID=UPI002E806C70|nr:alpha/beta hydrolase-fold protein [Streptomyces sp. NBC_00503]WUD83158.1 alpha/beta hydrolase-fold protein [Streptomyces sp. NBC_00503]
MSLTGTPLFATVVALTVLAVVLPLFVWSKVRGPAVVRVGSRGLMVVFAQVTAVTLVFIAVNRDMNFYASWGDLMGTGKYVTAAPDLGPDGLGGKKAAEVKAEPKVLQEFEPVDGVGGRVKKTELNGKISGVKGDVMVWLPPQYEDPAFKDKKFPVVELIPGIPGTGKSWFQGLKAHEVLEPLMKSGKVQPFILVSPRAMLVGQADTGCANIPGKVNADSWFSVDVRKMVVDNFRASEEARTWGVAGYSAGAYCAAKLAILHPDRYSAAVSLSGYNDPGQESTSLVAQDPEMRRVHNLKNLLTAAPAPPAVSLWMSGAEQDGYLSGTDLKGIAKNPTVVHAEKVTGGHNLDSWSKQLPQTFGWLTSVVKAP